MSAESTTTTAVWGWRILTFVSALLLLNGVGLYLFIVDTQVERTIGVLLAGFGAFALAVSVQGLRTGSPSSWRQSWITVAVLAALALHMLRGDRADLVGFYLGLAAVALVGQLLARPVGDGRSR